MSNAENPVCRIQKFNMKCEIERMEINYTFYFLPFLKKWLKNYWHFVTGEATIAFTYNSLQSESMARATPANMHIDIVSACCIK